MGNFIITPKYENICYFMQQYSQPNLLVIELTIMLSYKYNKVSISVV